jgi:hypothetical protein
MMYVQRRAQGGVAAVAPQSVSVCVWNVHRVRRKPLENLDRDGRGDRQQGRKGLMRDA